MPHLFAGVEALAGVLPPEGSTPALTNFTSKVPLPRKSEGIRRDLFFA